MIERCRWNKTANLELFCNRALIILTISLFVSKYKNEILYKIQKKKTEYRN